jgi:hypothetical protein
VPYSGNPTVKRFRTDMLEFQQQLAGALEDNLNRQADELMENMRGAVPIASGALRNSIRKKNISVSFGNRVRVTVLVIAGGTPTTRRTAAGAAYDYAVATEFGTEKEKAEPFFYSTSRRYEQVGRQMAAETVDQAIEENNKLRDIRASNYSNAGVTVTHSARGNAAFIKGKI